MSADSAATRDRARRTAAHYATDATDLTLLLDILGLGDREASCLECGLSMSRPCPTGHGLRGGDGLCWECFGKERRAKQQAPAPLCACSKRITDDGEHLCRTCRDFVPADDVRKLVERIGEATGLGPKHIAGRAGVNVTALSAVCIPSSTRQNVRRDIWDKLVALEQRYSETAIRGVIS